MLPDENRHVVGGRLSRSNKDGFSVTTKSDDRSWIEQPIHWWAIVALLYVVIGLLSSIGSILIFRRIFQGRWEQIFWSSFLVVIAAFYLSFAAYFGASTHAWQTEVVGVAVFLVCVVGGLFSRSAIAVGYVMHGLWDLSHCLSGSSLVGLSITEIPLSYGIFCSTYDFVVACYLMISDSAWHESGKFDLYFWRHRQ